MAPADWLLGCQKITLTHNKVFSHDAIIVRKSVKLANSEMHNDPYAS